MSPWRSARTLSLLLIAVGVTWWRWGLLAAVWAHATIDLCMSACDGAWALLLVPTVGLILATLWENVFASRISGPVDRVAVAVPDAGPPGVSAQDGLL